MKTTSFSRVALTIAARLSWLIWLGALSAGLGLSSGCAHLRAPRYDKELDALRSELEDLRSAKGTGDEDQIAFVRNQINILLEQREEAERRDDKENERSSAETLAWIGALAAGAKAVGGFAKLL